MQKNQTFFRRNCTLIPVFFHLTFQALANNFGPGLGAISASDSKSFEIVAPPPCIAAPTAPVDGQIVVCPGASFTLNWAASPGATSYDVYFGTSPNPPFAANVTNIFYFTGAPSSGTYYWQVRPRNTDGVAAGCAVWSFSVQ